MMHATTLRYSIILFISLVIIVFTVIIVVSNPFHFDITYLCPLNLLNPIRFLQTIHNI